MQVVLKQYIYCLIALFMLCTFKHPSFFLSRSPTNNHVFASHLLLTTRSLVHCLKCYYSSQATTKQNKSITTNKNNDAQPTKTIAKPSGYWANVQNQRQFFDQIAQKLNIKHLDDWYKFTAKDIKSLGGATLLRAYYGSSLMRALVAIYPEHQWQSRKFSRVYRGFWNDLNNQREFFDQISRELGIKTLDDWYNVAPEEVYSRGGRRLIFKQYNGSLIRALKAIYPDHPWQIEKFARVPNGFWLDRSNHKEFLERIGAELNVKTLDDWYNVSVSQVRERGGSGMLACYGSSLIRALQELYPEHPWQNDQRVPKGYWQDINNQREFFDRIGKELNVKQLDDWYNVTVDDLNSRGCGGLISNYYRDSLSAALKALYPEHPWDESRFARVPKHYWKNPANHRKFFDRISEELNIRKYEDWYAITADDVRAHGGSGLLRNYYGDSVPAALQALYPEHPWDISRFTRVPNGFWDDIGTQRKLFDQIAEKLNIRQPEDWYKVTADQVYAHGGGTVMRRYHNTMIHALQAIYPEHTWHHWKCARITSMVSKDSTDALAEYMSALEREFSIQHLDDWYRVSADLIYQFGGATFLKRNGGLYLVLKKLYPNHPWDPRKFQKSLKKSGQRQLIIGIQKIFPDRELMEDYLHPELLFANSHEPMQLDAYIPSLSLAFEYQGQQHYKDIHVFGTIARYNSHDMEKVQTCAKAGITLVTIPYWWDRTAESLAATICAIRPELAQEMPQELRATSSSARPIPQEPPETPSCSGADVQKQHSQPSSSTKAAEAGTETETEAEAEAEQQHQQQEGEEPTVILS